MKRLAGMLVSVALLLPACGPPETVQAELLDLTDRYLEARNNFVTAAAGSGIDPSVGMTPEFREQVKADLPVLESRRSVEPVYAHAETRLTALSWGYGGTTVTLVADEHTRFAYADLNTPYSEYAMERTFKFVRADDGRWLMSADIWPTEGHLPETVVW